MTHPRRRPAARTLALALALPTVLGLSALAACAPGTADDDRPQVVVAFYPLQFVAERVGGDRVDVTNLTPPGGEPHDLELSPNAVTQIAGSDVVLYVAGLQAATDEAVVSGAPARPVDALDAAGLPSDVTDPHFWLDPTLLAPVAEAAADALADADPDHAADYRAGAAALVDDLTVLDAELTAGLAPCRGATLVASHEAFGYLADRYGLEQTGITGIDPEVEPSPARLREVAAVVQETGVRTLFFGALTSPAVTETLAADLGVGTAVLDPLEGHDGDQDYLDVMRANLAALTTGLTCTA
jgi:zinc transport system substrate-binding protein